MSRPSYVATAGGFCMAGSSRPSAPVDAAVKAAVASTVTPSKPAQVVSGNKPATSTSLK